MVCCNYLGFAGQQGGGGVVDSVFGRIGMVVAQLGDYSSALVSDASSLGGPTVLASLNAADADISAAQDDATQALADAAAALAAANAAQSDATQALADAAAAQATANAAVVADGGTLTNGNLVDTFVTGLFDADGAGAVLVPTVAFPNSSTDAASTAFVSGNFAPQVSPTLTGTVTMSGATSVTAPTPAVGNSSTNVASTAFVQEALRNLVRRTMGGVNEFDDFISSTTTSGDLPWSTSANGAASSIGPANAAAVGAIGYRSFTAGTSATGRAAYTRSELVATQAAFVTPWLDGTFTMAYRIQVPVLPVVAADFPVYSFSLGTGLTVASDHFVNGIGLRYARNVTDQWVLASRSGAADVASANTGVAPIAGAWQVLVLVISGATATAYIGATYAAALAGGVLASITTVGAYTGMLSPLMKINNTAATAAARVILVDAYALDFNLATPR